jgi:hypothetical protein
MKTIENAVLKSGSSFADEVEELVWDRDIPYMDAIIQWCNEREMELEYAGTLVKKNVELKTKLLAEAVELNFVKVD